MLILMFKAGAKIGVQIYHAGRETLSLLTGEKPVAPSAIQDPTMPETPIQMTTKEVKEMVEKFAQAIRRCKEVGYDIIELHGAHGYLLRLKRVDLMKFCTVLDVDKGKKLWSLVVDLLVWKLPSLQQKEVMM